MARSIHATLALTFLSTLAGLGCGPGGAAEAIRPETPTASNALGEAQTECRDVKAGGEPLVVDWKPEKRGDLEVAMSDGVAIVKYSCEGIELLKDCKIDGSYGFIGMTKREQVVRLESADEVHANLPLSGASIGGEVSRGSKVDIAMILVGKKRTTWAEPTQKDLQGTCAGATHYVRGATVGAFVIEMGSQAKARAAAEFFGASAGGSSESSKETRQQEGDPKDCASAKPDADKPPSQCGAPVRLVLAPVAAAPAEGEAPPAAPPPPAETSQCPAGLVFADGKCTSASAAASYLCAPGDAADCTAQCDKGHAGSCAELARMYAKGAGVARDAAKANEAAKKACDGDAPAGCVTLGLLAEEGGTDGAALYEKGCSGGVALGCERLGRLHIAGKGVAQDAAKALGLLRKGCDGGEDTSCAAAADLLASGSGDAVPADAAAAKELHQRACQGTVASSCAALGALLEAGGPAGAVQAEHVYRRGCFRGHAAACFHLGRLEMARSPDAAKRSFDSACMRNDILGCSAMVVLFDAKRVVVPPPALKMELMKSCNTGNVRDCSIGGLVEAASKGAMAKSMLDRACMRGDKLACAVKEKVK